MENDALKKCRKITGNLKSQVSSVRQEAEYLTIEELKHKDPITHLCEILGVSRASYYKWLKQEPSKTELKRLKLIKWIKEIHEAFKGFTVIEE